MDEETEFNPAARRLCPDGTCVGVIGPDGRCTECGRQAGPASGAGGGSPAGARRVALVPGVGQEGEDVGPLASGQDRGTDDGVDPGGDAGARGGGESEGFDPNRRLCPDGACVGVIGRDGKCNVCGRVAGS